MLVRCNKDFFFLVKSNDSDMCFFLLLGTASLAILGQVRNNVMQLNLRALRAFLCSLDAGSSLNPNIQYV